MKLKLLGTAITLSFASSIALASDYRTEWVASNSDLRGMDIYAFSGKVHLKPVPTAGHPLSQAAFREQIGGGEITHTRFDRRPGSVSLSRLNLDHYVPESMLYVGVHLTRIRRSDDARDLSSSDNDWGLTLGVTPIEGLRVSTAYRAAPIMTASNLFHLVTTSGSMKEGEYNPNLAVKYVTDLSGETALNVEAAFIDQSTADAVYLGTDYFFDSRSSVGAWFEGSGVGRSNTGYGIRAETFFTPQFSIQTSYFNLNEADIWRARAHLRF